VSAEEHGECHTDEAEMVGAGRPDDRGRCVGLSPEPRRVESTSRSPPAGTLVCRTVGAKYVVSRNTLGRSGDCAENVGAAPGRERNDQTDHKLPLEHSRSSSHSSAKTTKSARSYFM